MSAMMESDVDLVTGAFGFAATHLIAKLLARGRRVVAIDLPGVLQDAKRRALATRLGVDLAHPQLELVPADLLDPATLTPLFARPIRRVFHTASLYDYSAPLERLRRVNVDGTRNLLACALDAKLERFIHWSTCGVFGKPYTASYGKRCNVPFTEDSSSPKNTPPGATEPVGTHLANDYSITKWEQEKMIWQAHRDRGLPVTVIRPAPIYGPGGNYGHGGIILAVARGLVPTVPRDARNFISASVHVSDLTEFACWIAEQPNAVGEDYNVTDSSVISYSEFMHYIALLVGRRMWDFPVLTPMSVIRRIAIGAATLWTSLERRFGLPRVRIFEVQSATYIGSSYWISNRKTLRAGFVYQYPDVREGLKDTVAWMHDMGWL
jgi:nucleoside-diphosphate-sugar epimerase